MFPIQLHEDPGMMYAPQMGTIYPMADTKENFASVLGPVNETSNRLINTASYLLHTRRRAVLSVFSGIVTEKCVSLYMFFCRRRGFFARKMKIIWAPVMQVAIKGQF